MIRKHIIFTGIVQGVGFRWRAFHAANCLGCTGWCRNEPDGTVTMEIQGEKEAIQAVIRTIEHGRFIQIDSMDMKDMSVLSEEKGFTTE